MNSNETTSRTLPELRVDLVRNKACFLTEFHKFRKYLESIYTGHYKIVWTQHKPHLIFLQQGGGLARKMPVMFRDGVNKRDNLKALVVSVTAEPALPLPGVDHSFSFYPTTNTNTWFPDSVYSLREEFIAMLNGRRQVDALTPKPNFCAFIYTNENTNILPHLQNRLDLCAELMKYKKVLCPGKSMNNVQAPDYLQTNDYGEPDYIKGLIRYLAESKFFIAFENSLSSRSEPTSIRYVTTKIMAAFVAGSIPIYSGYREITELFNPAAFINAHDFSSRQELVEYVKKVDNSPELAATYQNAPPILPESPLYDLHPDKMRPIFLSLAERALQRSSKPFILQPDLLYKYKLYLKFVLRGKIKIKRSAFMGSG